MLYETYLKIEEQLGPPADFIAVIVSTTGIIKECVAWWPPIFDRTLDDCVYGSVKCAFDYACINRIEANTEYATYQMMRRGYLTAAVFTHAAWQRAEYIRENEYSRIRDNCAYFVPFLNMLSLLPEVKTAESPLDYVDINILERLAYEVLAALDRLDASTLLCGEACCGE